MREGVNRKIYISALVSVSAALALFRVFALPRLDHDANPSATEVIADVTDSFLGSALAALGVSLLVLWLFARHDPADDAVVIAPRAISAQLTKEAESTTEWNYRGHTGRYFRTAILPILEQGAKEYGRHITVCAELLDPANAQAVEFFVRYRRQVVPDKADYWTPSRARAEILATIVKLSLARHSSPRLHCSIFIGSSVTPTTVDVSSSVAILTRESSRMAALKYLRGSGFFDAIQEDLYVSREQAKEVRRLPPDDYHLDTTADLRRIIEELELVSVDDDTLTATLHAIAYPVTPYDGGRERKR